MQKGGKRTWTAGVPKKKPDYDPDGMMEELLEAVVDIYENGRKSDSSGENERLSLKAAAEMLQAQGYGSISPAKVRKILITAHFQNLTTYPCPAAEEAYVLRKQGHTIDEIAAITGKSRKAVCANLPYEKIIYKLDETPDGDISVGAERARIFKKRKKAVEKLQEELTADNLWAAVIVFENYPFKTISGLPFTYSFKPNRYGKKGNELCISRKEKTITRSSIEVAFDKVMERGKIPARMTTPKELGVFGASYIYPLFIRFGLVEHVESSKRKRR